MSGPEAEGTKKLFISIFKSFGFKIDIVTNLKCVDFLDVFFDLRNGSYQPFKKPNDDPVYVNCNSNHPSNILKQLPLMINKRLCNISSDEVQFCRHKEYYENKLKDAGYAHQLTFNKMNKTKKCRKRKILWYNPPFNKNVKTNIGNKFLDLLKKHFPSTSKFHSLFNKNNIKISYSCMPDMASIINKHNKSILRADSPEPVGGCNCRTGLSTCPLNGECLTDNVIYRAEVVTDNDNKLYFGSCSTTFKERYGDHKMSINNINYKNKTELSTYTWQLKDKKIDFKVNWKIIARAQCYKKGSFSCNLCLTERYFILKADRNTILNNRESMTKCLHRVKCKFKSMKFS